MKKTISEQIFEDFCTQNNLEFHRVPESPEKTPDYQVLINGAAIAVEIKQLEGMSGFNPHGVSSRTVGSHVRKQISAARGQMKVAAKAGIPSILLIHNTVDPLQLFGTEQHDFLCAMYGDLTIRIGLRDFEKSEAFHGRNAQIRSDTNTSFSGIGHLRKTQTGAKVTVYENAYAANALPFDSLPSCIEFVRITIEPPTN